MVVPVRYTRVIPGLEAAIRLAAAKAWIDHALAGHCTDEQAVQAVRMLMVDATGFIAEESHKPDGGAL